MSESVVEQTTQIASARETVWGLLVNAAGWKSWWSDCVEALTPDHKPLREGSELELVLHPRHRKLTFRPVVDMVSEGKTLSLTYRGLFLQFTVVWTVEDGPTGARVSVRGVFTGFVLWLQGLVSQKDVYRAVLGRNLRDLRKIAERMV